MNKRDFIIPFVGLKDEVHQFEFELDETFFDNAANQVSVEAPEVKVDLQFDKTHEPYVLNFSVTGTYQDECDRCASQIRVPLYGRFRLFVEFGNIENEDETEVIYISREQHEIDLTEHIHDFVYLAIPMVKRCESEADLTNCNKKVEAFLDKVNQPQEETIDPRWESLKKLKK